MVRMVAQSEASCVEPIHQDFLTVDPSSSDAAHVQMVLVDPSCSGSGMLNAGSDSHNTDKHRLETLKRFQITILKHALRFPGVQRLVYSTCSVHPEENEQVVEEVMAQVSSKFEFDPVFPTWKSSRGLPEFPNASCFLRLSPQQDLTQGFFVACFKRVAGETYVSVTDEYRLGKTPVSTNVPCSGTIPQVSNRSVSAVHSCGKPCKGLEPSHNVECAEMGKMRRSKKKANSHHSCEDVGKEEASGNILTSPTTQTCVSPGTKKLKVKAALSGEVQSSAVQLDANKGEVTREVVSTAMSSSFRKKKKKTGKKMLSGIECVQLEGEKDRLEETRIGVTTGSYVNGHVTHRSKKRKKSSSGKGESIQDEESDNETVLHKVSKTSFEEVVINKAVSSKPKKKKKNKKLDKQDSQNMDDTDIRAQCGSSCAEDRKSYTSQIHSLPEKSVDLMVSLKRKKKRHRDKAVVHVSSQVIPSTAEHLKENVNVEVVALVVDNEENLTGEDSVDNHAWSERRKKKKRRKHQKD